jgi:hypothetical protein
MTFAMTGSSRVAIAFVITPILASVLLTIVTLQGFWLLFGPIFIYPFMVAIGLPVFLVFWKLKWLEWWHAAGIGLLTSAVFVWLWEGSINPYHVEIYGLQEGSLYLTAGYLTGLVFWFAGIYRNAVFPHAHSRLALVSVFPLAVMIAGANYLQMALATSNEKGTITALLEPVDGKPMVRIETESNTSAEARLFCYYGSTVGQQIYLTHRKASSFFKERYWSEGAVIEPDVKIDQKAWTKDSTACYEEGMRSYRN